MAYYTYQTTRKITDGDTVQMVTYDKAYTSINWKGNTAETNIITDWNTIEFISPPVIGLIDSGNCEIIDNQDNTYYCKYIDPEDYNRMFNMNVILYVDCSVNATIKDLEFRMSYIYGGIQYNLNPFCQIVSGEDGVCISGTTLFELYPDVEVFFQVKNNTDNNNVIIKSGEITVLEL